MGTLKMKSWRSIIQTGKWTSAAIKQSANQDSEKPINPKTKTSKKRKTIHKQNSSSNTHQSLQDSEFHSTTTELAINKHQLTNKIHKK